MRIGQLVSLRKRNRQKGKANRVNRKRKRTIRVMSNIAKPWWGREAMTPNMWGNI